MKLALLLSQTTFLALVSASYLKETVKDDLVSVLDIKKVEQEDHDHVYDYSLKPSFRHLPRPTWLRNWDDLMFNSLGEEKYDVKVDPKAGNDAIAHMLLFSLASGYSVDTWHEEGLQKRFEGANLEGMMDTLWETGDVSTDLLETYSGEIERQSGARIPQKRHIHKVDNLHWIYAEENRARVSALMRLKENLDAKNGELVRYGRTAICETRDTWRGCLSWSGDALWIRSNIAAQAIGSGISGYPEDGWVSAKAHDAFHDRIWNMVYWKEVTYNVCLSNRPNGCT